MWRFILITFGFLGFAFWELSGGADYKPHENSLQARAAQQADVSVAALDDAETPESATTLETVTAPATLTDLQDTNADRFEITLASIDTKLNATAEGSKREKAPETKVEVLTQPSSDEDTAVLAALENTEEEVRTIWPGAIELFEQQKARQDLRAEAKAVAEATQDIRYVTGNVVNMRGGPGTEFGKIAALTEGTEVTVLSAPGNGWLELQVTNTGEIGWMADWLVSAPAQ